MERKNLFILLTLMLGNFAIGTGTLIFPGILFSLSEELGVSITKAGQLVTFYALSYAVAAPTIASFTQNVDKKTMLIIASFILIGGYGLSMSSHSYSMVVVGQIIAAIGAAIFSPTSSVVAVNISKPENRTKAIGFVFSGFALGTAIGLPVSAYLGEQYGWQYALGVIIISAFVTLLFIVAFLQKGIIGEALQLNAFKRLIKRKAIKGTLLTSILQMALQMTVFTFIAVVLNYYGNIPSEEIPFFLTIFGLAAVIGTFLGSFIADKIGTKNVIFSTAIGLGLAFISFNISGGSLIMVTASLFLWAFMGFAFFPSLQAHLVGLSPKHSGILLAINSSAIYLGSAIGSYNGSQIIKYFEIPYLTYFGFGLAIVSAVIFYRMNGEAKDLGYAP